MMSPHDTAALFRFESPGLSVEFEGPEAFIAAQIEFLVDRLRLEMDRATPPRAASAAPQPEPAPEKPAQSTAPPPPAHDTVGPTLLEFYESARSRQGRGALQEKILIFAYYVHTYRHKVEFSIDDLAACFDVVGATPPRSLANTLGIMKRNQELFRAGNARGHYALTEKGLAYVRRLIGAQ